VNLENKNFWSQPWSVKQGFLLAFSFSFLGFLMEITIKGVEVAFPPFPFNLIFLGFFITIFTIIYFVFRKKTWIRFFSSISAAIPAIAVFVGIVLIMGLVPQQEQAPQWIKQLGFNHVLHHLMFYCSFLYLMVVLLFTVCKRVYPFSWNNVSFMFNHLGLLVILLGGVFGAGDMYRIKMVCGYGQPIWYGTDDKGKMYELPLALELQEFDIEFYEPEIVTLNTTTGKPVDLKPNPDLSLSNHKKIILKNDITLIVDTLYLHAMKMNQRYYPIEAVGSSTAAKLKVIQTSTGSVIKEGWLSTETFMQPFQVLTIDDETTLYLSSLKPKKYRSELKLFTPDMNPKSITLEVNKPYYCNGWKLYQVSYDQTKGKWSEYSVIEAVRDPWLPVVYTGIGMMILGALMMIFQIRKKGSHE